MLGYCHAQPRAWEPKEDDAMIDRMTIREGDEVWVAQAGCNHGEPYIHIRGGTVVATGGDGGFVYRAADGRVDSYPAWMVGSLVATEAEAWEVAADKLDALAAAVAAKAASCRVEVPA
jgi:hypothetical protein